MENKRSKNTEPNEQRQTNYNLEEKKQTLFQFWFLNQW